MASSQLVVFVVAACLIGSIASRTVVVNPEENDVNPDKQEKVDGVAVAVDVAAAPALTPLKPVTVVAVSKPVNPNLYNDIFNIPTSILSAVNRLLNNGAASLGLGGGGGGAHVAVAGAASKDAGHVGDVASRIGDKEDTGVGGGAGVTVVVNKPAQPQGGFFDNIFNIPISALNAVNQLLNNNHRNGKK